MLQSGHPEEDTQDRRAWQLQDATAAHAGTQRHNRQTARVEASDRPALSPRSKEALCCKSRPHKDADSAPSRTVAAAMIPGRKQGHISDPQLRRT
ncbi:MAG: hypothetical protein ACPIOQ_46490, partial [Promethearchaeia archaeon]